MTQYLYCRVSTNMQSTANQTNQLIKQFPEAILVEEVASGAKKRPLLDELVGKLMKGDELIISALDRLGRKTSEILVLIEELEDKGVILKSLREGIDYSTIAGRLVTQILVSISEMERSILSERTKLALAAKREQGIVGGRPRIYNDKKIAEVKAMRENGKTYKVISDTTEISISRCYQICNN